MKKCLDGYFSGERPVIVLAAINAKWIHPSLALRLLKANLGDLESSCRILEFTLRQNRSDIAGSILAEQPTILGLSVSIWNHEATLELLKTLEGKWRKPDAPEPRTKQPHIILGGPEVSWLPDDSEIFRYADYVIRGEGEEAFRELCGQLTGSVNSAAAVLTNTAAAENTPAIFITPILPDIAKLVSPYYLYTDEDLGSKLIYAESSRGCVFNCDFCQSSIKPQTGIVKLREISTEKFLADMDHLLERIVAVSRPDGKSGPVRNIKFTIKFIDRSFNINPERAVKILDFFLKKILTGKTPFCVHFEMVPFNFTAELRERLENFPAGSLRIELGIQTLNPAAAALINRPGKTGEALEVLSFLVNQTKAIVHADLIAGLPGENMESFGRGFDRLWIALTSTGPGSLPELPAAEIQPGILKLLPGTPMTRHTAAFGMKYAARPPYEVLETSVIPAVEMDRIKNFARFWEVIVNRNNFPDFVSSLVRGEPVFRQFMELSDRLLAKFGRNWGISRAELRDALWLSSGS